MAKRPVWTQAIYNAFNDNICEYDDEVLRSKEKEIIDRIAVVNVKKSNGGSESEYEDLKKYALEDRLEIKRELEIIQPDIIVCGNNLSLLKLVLGEELQNDDTWDNMLALWKDTLVLDYYHPAVHYPNRVNYYALMAICDVARKKYGCKYVQGARPWGEKCDIAMPSATQNELNGDDAKKLVANGVMAVSEGANMPSTPEAVKVFQEAKILYAPGKAANAGGVSVSGLEMTQNSIKLSWSAEEVDEKLKSIMKNIHEACVQYGTEADGYVNYVKGANVAGFMKVAKAMMAQGIV